MIREVLILIHSFGAPTVCGSKGKREANKLEHKGTWQCEQPGQLLNQSRSSGKSHENVKYLLKSCQLAVTMAYENMAISEAVIAVLCSD